MNRRNFLCHIETLSAGALVGGLGLTATGCLGFHYVNASVRGNRLMIRKVDFSDGRFVLVDAPRFQLPLFVYRGDDGGYTAVSTRCMHRGCQVEPAADRLVCPCHGSEYTNTGEVLKGPTQQALHRFPVTIEGEAIAIELPAGGDVW